MGDTSVLLTKDDYDDAFIDLHFAAIYIQIILLLWELQG
jgi:hypothetical protein